jgi:hypothetical protein
MTDTKNWDSPQPSPKIDPMHKYALGPNAVALAFVLLSRVESTAVKTTK